MSPLITVVDDEDSVRHALRRLLLAAGLAVETYASGEEFMGSLCTHQPDCLVLDLQMPAPDGFEIQSRMNENWPSIPIVVITGHDMPQSREIVIGAGASAYLQKPVDELVLLGAIKRALEKSPTPRRWSLPPI
jgi:FixJ family two-component response regulator